MRHVARATVAVLIALLFGAGPAPEPGRADAGNIALDGTFVATTAGDVISAGVAAADATEPAERVGDSGPVPVPPGDGVYWGGWIQRWTDGVRTEAPFDMSVATDFAAAVGKAPSIIHWSSPFFSSGCGGYCAFRASDFDRVRTFGSIPLFTWAPSPGTGEFTTALIAAGSQDDYLRSWAQAARIWGHPMFLRFAWEMNGSWFPWGVGPNASTTSDYLTMWHRVHDIFDAVGATNVSWVWCPNVDPLHKFVDVANLYPGDAYVDWTCLDGYNGNDPRMSFTDLYAATYDELQHIAPDKPVMIAEVASTETGGSKAQWISQMFASLPAQFPQVKAVVWFEKSDVGPGGYTDWPLSSSAAATQAFATAIQPPRYSANVFATLFSAAR